MCWQFRFLPRDAGIFFLGVVLMFPTVFPLHTMFSPPRPSPPTPPPHMSSFLSRPPYSWFLSVSLFSCRLFPFSNKMNPVIKQRNTFLKPILHHFSYFFSEGSRMSKKSGKPSSLHFYYASPMFLFPLIIPWVPSSLFIFPKRLL